MSELARKGETTDRFQKQSDATLGYERICDTETGEIYKAENGWSDGYHGDRYQLVSEDSMYLEPISGYIE